MKRGFMRHALHIECRPDEDKAHGHRRTPFHSTRNNSIND